LSRLLWTTRQAEVKLFAAHPADLRSPHLPRHVRLTVLEQSAAIMSRWAFWRMSRGRNAGVGDRRPTQLPKGSHLRRLLHRSRGLRSGPPARLTCSLKTVRSFLTLFHNQLRSQRSRRSRHKLPSRWKCQTDFSRAVILQRVRITILTRAIRARNRWPTITGDTERRAPCWPTVSGSVLTK
jgi:hypothetical protein